MSLLPLVLLAVQATPSRTVEAALVVVAPRAFTAGLAPFLEHRRRDLSVELLVYEDALAAHDGADEAEKLKRALHARWRERGMRYVLLAGDADRLPVRYMMLDRVHEPAFDVAFYGSDLYFGDLARTDGSFDDWNAHVDGFHAGYFGEVHGEHHKEGPINRDGIDYLPEVGVGRWPVSDERELDAVVAKTLAHDQAADWTVPRRACLLHVSGWVDATPVLEAVARTLQGWEVVRHGYGTDAPGFEAARVEATLLHGTDLLLHSGHGSPDGYDQSLGRASLARLATVPRLPIVLSAGCSTAYFATLPPYEDYVDISGVRHRGTNAGERFTEPPPPPACLQPQDLDRGGFGEQMLLGAGGAIAYFGCNTGGQPCGLTLVSEFAQAIGNGEAERLGDAWRLAVTRYHAKERLAELRPDAGWYPPSIFFQAMKYPLFGDPSLPVQPPPVWRALSSWAGTYAGKLRIHGARTEPDVAMRLVLEPRDGGRSMRFQITYGDGDRAQVRDYVLLAGSGEGRFRIDERNGIVLDALLHEDVLSSSFAVQGQVNLASYALCRDGIEFRLVAWKADGGVDAGQQVTSLPLRTVQRAELARSH